VYGRWVGMDISVEPFLELIWFIWASQQKEKNEVYSSRDACSVLTKNAKKGKRY